MAVKIERGGWVLIFLVGVALVGYSLNRYGVIDLSKWTGGKSSSASGETVDATQPVLLPASSTRGDAKGRVRVNAWVGCAGGLVANRDLDPEPQSTYRHKRLNAA